MARTWRFTTTDSDLSLGWVYNKAMADAGLGTLEQTAPSGSGSTMGAFYSPSSVELDGQVNSGSWAVVLNVSAAANNTTAEVILVRYNAAGTQQAFVSSSEGAISTATTGDKTWTWSNPALGSWAAGDRLGIRVQVVNNNAHGSASGPTFDLAATNTRIDTPFTLATQVNKDIQALWNDLAPAGEAVQGLWNDLVLVGKEVETLWDILAPYPSAVLALSPIAYWRLGEPSGTTAVDKQGAHDGAYEGATPGAAGLLANDGDTAGTWDATGEQVAVPSASALNPTAGIALALWAESSSWNGNNRLLQKGNSDNQYRIIRGSGSDPHVGSGNIGAHFRNALGQDVVAQVAAPAVDTPFFLVATYDAASGVARLYIDGVEVATGSGTAGSNLNTTTDDLAIGNKLDAAVSGDNFLGVIDEVAIFGALTAQDVTDLYAAGSGIITVNKDIEFVYHLAAAVNQDVEFLHNLAELVSTDTQVLWNTSTSVGQDVQALWDIDATVAVEVQALWSLNAVAGKEVETLWDILGAATVVGNNLEALWNLSAHVGDTVVLEYNVAAAVGTPVEFPWNVTTLTLRDLEALWGVNVGVGQEQEYPWNVLVAAGQEVELPYNTFALAQKDLVIDWFTKALIANDLSSVWNVLRAVGVEEEFLWDAIGVIGKDLEAIWHVISEQLIANRDLGLLWDTRAIVNADSQGVWNILVPAAKAVEVPWSILELAQTDLAVPWNTLITTGSEVETLWRLLQAAGVDTELRWDTLALTQVFQLLQMMWNVESLSDIPPASIQMRPLVRMTTTTPRMTPHVGVMVSGVHND